jgi:hypothetical protein
MARPSDVQLGTPTRAKGQPVRAERGRLCDAVGCSTVLSTYNAATTCWLHARPEYRHPLHRG